MGLFTLHNCSTAVSHVQWTSYNPNLSLKAVFLFLRFLVLSLIKYARGLLNNWRNMLYHFQNSLVWASHWEFFSLFFFSILFFSQLSFYASKGNYALYRINFKFLWTYLFSLNRNKISAEAYSVHSTQL